MVKPPPPEKARQWRRERKPRFGQQPVFRRTPSPSPVANRAARAASSGAWSAVALQVKEEIQEMVRITSHAEALRGGEAGVSRTSPTTASKL